MKKLLDKFGVTALSPRFYFFTFIIFLFYLSDGAFSYSVPIYVDNIVKDTFLLGLLFSFSSMVAFIYDYYSGKANKSKKYKLFLLTSALLAFLMPLLLFSFNNSLFILIVVLGFWGIFYETSLFAHFRYIEKSVTKDTYTTAWGTSTNIESLAYILGPALAALLVVASLKISFVFSIIISFLALLLTLKFILPFKKNPFPLFTNLPHMNVAEEKKTLKIWWVLTERVWILLVLVLITGIITSSIWTIGIVYFESLSKSNPLAKFIITIDMIPKAFVGLFLPYLSKIKGKKYLAYVSSVLSAIFFFFISLTLNVYLISLYILLSSLFMSLVYPSLFATFEDYISRLHNHSNEMMGLEQTFRNIGSILGPVLSGIIAIVFGYQKIFYFWGLLLFGFGILSLLISPRKIKMPQETLHIIDEK